MKLSLLLQSETLRYSVQLQLAKKAFVLLNVDFVSELPQERDPTLKAEILNFLKIVIDIAQIGRQILNVKVLLGKHRTCSLNILRSQTAASSIYCFFALHVPTSSNCFLHTCKLFFWNVYLKRNILILHRSLIF
jgi:hypothetical protein